eukprot:CAMPEP_0198589714 /NCGR_PEP_ID=MMETSP1462-20131121/134743_1 /TAXON_ID=1333877 /ORGANISM="Brandtodinium nutriculum, Strain RCC3387" /LENGTH=30 /DNA_ID= /DNA_START= /DNA_END= /DNA_ORIENTATION=
MTPKPACMLFSKALRSGSEEQKLRTSAVLA